MRKGQSAEALEYLRRAAGLEQQNPYYLSFLGVCLARAQSKWTAAVELCKTAINIKRKDAQLYMNLADVYVLATAARSCHRDTRYRLDILQS